MQNDIEEQIATYFQWVEVSTGFPLHAEAAAERSAVAVEPDVTLNGRSSLDDASVIELEVPKRRRPRTLRLVAIAGLAAAVIVGVILIGNRPVDEPSVPVNSGLPIDTVSQDEATRRQAAETAYEELRRHAEEAARKAAEAVAFQPPGTEFPMSDLGVPVLSTGGTTLASLSRSLGVEGHVMTVLTDLEYSGGPMPFLSRCLSERGSAGCNPEWNSAALDVQITSSVDNGFAVDNLWAWSNVPDGAEFVAYVDGGRLLWQHPIAGVALFPDVTGNDEVVIAYSHDGTELGRVDQQTMATSEQAAGAVPMPKSADISQAQYQELSSLTASSLTGCLEAAGATFTGSVASLPPGSDENVVWNRCVAAAKDAVVGRLTELDVRFYDPRTEHPENPDSPFKSVVVTEQPSG